ncbi:outer membrane protein assembly factor BamD [Paenibacillus tianjinensis]|uniref:Lipoprotein n=1 Tax=Paenibacillus tianjinensis TaxID=2810347 RepID=A0ABX7L4B2_9BACL|nr:hypothetical protein [Paenibacillus tianjinensis]QSF42710.1 hypothetical protein JRJ22_15450 [Paenibacillus tianjinensis]
MRKFIMVLSIMLLLAGCGPSKADQAAELSTQAEQHYKDGDLQSAKAVYEKSLEIKEDAEIRQKLTLTESEITALATVRQYLSDLSAANQELKQNIDPTALYETSVKIDSILNELTEVPVPDYSSITVYLDRIKEDNNFFLLKSDVELFTLSAQSGIEVDAVKLNKSVQKFLDEYSTISNYK